MMQISDNVIDLVDLAINHAKDKVDSVIARGILSKRTQIRFSQNNIDISKNWDTFTFQTFIVLDGPKTGFDERTVANKEDIIKAVDDTISFTKRLPNSMFYAGIEESVHEYSKLENCYDPKIREFMENSPDIVNQAIESALSEGAVRVAGALMLSEESSYFQSSYGPNGEGKKTKYDFNVRAFQEQLDYSGQGISCGTIPSNSENDMLQVSKQAGRLSKQAIGAKQGEPGTYDLVLSPTVAADIIGYIPKVADPFSVMTGRSPLGDKMGEQLAPEFVTVEDNPLFPGGMSSRAFDFEGTPSQRTTIIEDGVLKAFVHNTSTARMYETSSTGSSTPVSMMRGIRMLLPSYSNIVFKNGDKSLSELLDNDKPTIYVTSNWYTRFQNSLTGEFSTIPRDAMLLYEKGEIKPIKNLRISDNILRMFVNIDALGNNRKQIFWWEVRTPTIIPSVRVSDCRMSAATL
jgi:PmbA protein